MVTRHVSLPRVLTRKDHQRSRLTRRRGYPRGASGPFGLDMRHVSQASEPFAWVKRPRWPPQSLFSLTSWAIRQIRILHKYLFDSQNISDHPPHLVEDSVPVNGPPRHWQAGDDRRGGEVTRVP